MRQVSLREANQNFSSCIAEVEAGERLVLLRRGQPVAEIIPYKEKGKLDPEREATRARMLASMRKGIPMDGKPLTRDEIYER